MGASKTKNPEKRIQILGRKTTIEEEKASIEAINELWPKPVNYDITHEAVQEGQSSLVDY